ncbi:MAG TPA: Rne/Rng family ribonuclease [Deltaproteobacteria bacterium]|nr:Rne/Rng family ribonuclease [Deltaproteobacteria bacterium]
MPSEIICSTTGREVRVALMEDGRLAELQIDRGDERGFVGNVYLGRVVRVLPGMQAAFVDIGLERAAFLYVGDIYPDMLNLHESQLGIDGPPAPEDRPRASAKSGQPAIQDLLKEGQEIVVQVAKDPIGTKGARLTTHLALPGRYLVFMPTVEHVGISRRIEREKERRRLREFVERHRKPGMGYIVRTVCEGAPTASLKADMAFLELSWGRIQEACRGQRAPSLLHSEYGLVLRAVRDLFDEDVERMVIDDRGIFDQVRSFVDDFMPRAKDQVHLYRGLEPVFDTYGVETEILRSMGRKVWLKSGGYLVIDQTEALMAIDVNSGKFVGSSSLEDTTLRINLEAVQEVVAQLRLRNIGGLIIIDFIDMDREQNRDKVFRALDEALKIDRARTNVLRISDLGLVEMTRKRVQEGLDRYLTDSCPTCNGTGVVRSQTTLAYEILREVCREAERSSGDSTVYVNTTPGVADLLYGNQFPDLEQIEGQTGRRVVVRAMGHFHPEQFEVYSR